MNKLALVVGMLMVVGCGGGIDDPTFGSSESTSSGDLICTPGKQEECPCPDGIKGAQACNSEGNGYLACQCGVTNGSGGNGSGGNGPVTSSSSNSSSGQGTGGGGGSCVPKTKEEACKTFVPGWGQEFTMDCGDAEDGCGNTIACGSCSGSFVCGGFIQGTDTNNPGVCGTLWYSIGSCGLNGDMKRLITLYEINDFDSEFQNSHCTSTSGTIPTNDWCCKG